MSDEENPLRSLGACMACSSKDWGENKDDAWLWGVIHGWDGASRHEMMDKYGWTEEVMDRLSRLHDVFERTAHGS